MSVHDNEWDFVAAVAIVCVLFGMIVWRGCDAYLDGERMRHQLKVECLRHGTPTKDCY